jgi:cytochrome c-type biogenesis protein CcmE
VDLTPRTLDEPVRPARRRRSPWAVGVLVLVLATAAFVVFRGLSDATLFFYNADEAVARRDELGDRRFRIQGEVQEGVVQDGDEVSFEIEFNDVAVPVRHVGDPPDLFRPGIPVVLEGSWDGEVFASDRILVKHSNEYREENPDRVPADAP